MKPFFITETIPEKSPILLIDVEERYFEELLDVFEEPNTEQRIFDRLSRMRSKLLLLKENGHPILCSTNGDVHPMIDDLVDVYLPQWDREGLLADESLTITERHILTKDIIEEVGKYEHVVICGLWKELCVYIVSRKLQETYGKATPLLTNQDLTLEYGLSLDEDDALSLESECEADNVHLVCI